MLKYVRKSQKNWLNETGCKRVFDLRNAGDNKKANPAISIAFHCPPILFTIPEITIIEAKPTSMGKKRKAKTELPNNQTEKLLTQAIKGGTEA